MSHLNSLSDTELVYLFAGGNEQAFHHLYKRHQQNIYKVVVHYLKDRVVAEDVTQEVFIKIIHCIKERRYCEEGKFIAWALRIAHNHCMDHLRKPKRTSYVMVFSDTASAPMATSSPEAKMVDSQTATQLNQLIEKLPEEQKTVLRYRHFEELSFKEIAKRTNTSVNNSLGRMRYALMHLRTMTQNHP